jgi:P27 family predicted phage terminase small subunit
MPSDPFRFEGLTMSNPPIPFALRKLRGNPGRRPMRPEVEPPASAAVPEPPAWLSVYAIQEWHRVASSLWVLGILRVVDESCLAAYCMAYSHWREAEEAILALPADARLGDHGRRLQRLSRQWAHSMISFAGQFGMTAAARSRIAMGANPVPSKFGDLLA